MNDLKQIKKPDSKGTKEEFLSVNEIENLTNFEQEFISYLSCVSSEKQMSQKQLAFLIKFPQFGMKLTASLMKELIKSFNCDIIKLIEENEAELAKLPEKKQASKIEDIRDQCDESIMIVLKSIISIYKQLKQINVPDGTDMVQEIYIPAIVKTYFKELEGSK